MIKRFNSAIVILIISLLVTLISVSCAGTSSSDRAASFIELENEVADLADLITDYKQLKQYFLAVGYGKTEPSHDFHFNYKGKDWSVNKSAIAAFYDNTGNCGAGSNLFCYLLNGDYSELGYLYRRDNSGGHIINYFCDNNGLWHIVDVAGFLGGNDYANHITGKSLQAVADEYVRRVDYGWKANNLNLYIRSLYAIKNNNGEAHPPICSSLVQEGPKTGYFTADERDRVIELYVKDGDSKNSIQFVDYSIPTSSYPSGIGYGTYSKSNNMEKLKGFASHAKEIAASLT